jgi:Tol biopolymer transport system component
MLARRSIQSLVAALPCLGIVPAAAAQIARVTPTRISPVVGRDLSHPAESPDGRFLVAVGDSGMYEYDRTSSRWSRLGDGGQGLKWSPDGRFLAFSRRDRATGWHVWVLPMDPKTGKATGAERRVTLRDGRLFCWSPDSKQIAFVSFDSGFTKIFVQPFNGGDERLIARARGGTIDAPAWSPDGKSIFFTAGTSAPGYVGRVTLSTGKVDSLRPMRSLTGISADGKYLAQSNPALNTVIVSSATDGREVKRIYLPHRVRAIAWSAAKPSELFGIENPIWQQVHSVSLADGSIRKLVAADSTQAGGVRISPDGARLVYTVDNHVFISKTDGTSPRAVKTERDVLPLSASWSPDGSRIAYVSADPREIRVVEIATGRETRLAELQNTLALPGRSLNQVWRRDGQAIRYTRLDLGRSGVTYSVREVTLAGHDSLIAVIEEKDSQCCFRFLNDTLYARGNNAGVAVLNLSSRKWITLAQPRYLDAALSSDGSTMIFSHWASPNSDDAELYLVQGTTTKTIPNPLGGELSQLHFLPDRHNVIAAVCRTCEQGLERRSLVMFPLNGDPPRVLSGKEGSIMDWDDLAITPDGRTVIYDPELAWRSAFVHIPTGLR